MQIEIDQNKTRIEATGTIIGDRELQLRKENNSLLDVKHMVDDKKSHRVDLFIIQDEQIEGIDTTGIDPYRSFNCSFTGYSSQFFDTGFVESITLFLIEELTKK